MRFIIFALLFLAIATTASADGLPSLTFKLIEHSIVRVETHLRLEELFTGVPTMATCTGFVVRPNTVITDNHCIFPGEAARVDGRPAIVINDDKDHDLILLEVETKKPPVTFRTETLPDNAEIFALGYALGADRPASTFHTVLWQHFSPSESQLPPGLWVRGQMFEGMSGSPIFDRAGHVVGIAQNSNTGLSYGEDLEHIDALLHGHLLK